MLGQTEGLSGQVAGTSLPCSRKFQRPGTTRPKSRVRTPIQLMTSADSPGAWPRREAGSMHGPRPGTDKALRGRHWKRKRRPKPSARHPAEWSAGGTRSPEGAECGHVRVCVHPARSVLWFAALSSCTKFTSKETCANTASTGRAGRSWAGARLCWTAPPGCARSWAGHSGRPGQPLPASRAASSKQLA